MDREQQEKIAIFRFGVIFPLVERDLHQWWGQKERIVKELAGKEWEIPFSDRTVISRGTILSWLKRYEDGGRKIEALFPKPRGDRGRRRSIDGETLDALVAMRRANPRLSIPRLVERAEREHLFPVGREPSMATIYRLLRLHKAETKKKREDMRKFEVQMSNDLWQSDCMHGPQVLHEGKRRKSYLFAIIDDHSRLITGAEFYLAETVENYLLCLWTALRKRGIPRKLYVDNGPSFKSHRLQLGCASLEIGLRYAKPYRPQGKGKIERFFKTVRGQFLPELPELPTLEQINRAFEEYLENDYHERKHGGTGMSPIDRYLKDAKALRRAPENLPEYFRKQVTRTVNNDRTVKLDNRLFEAPHGYIGEQIILRFENYERIEVFSDGLSVGLLTALNQEVNSRVRREKNPSASRPTSGGKLFEKLSEGNA
jgi:transposase InsO family protein